MIEVHDRPEEAQSDATQALLPEQFTALMGEMWRLAGTVDREMSSPSDQPLAQP